MQKKNQKTEKMKKKNPSPSAGKKLTKAQTAEANLARRRSGVSTGMGSGRTGSGKPTMFNDVKPNAVSSAVRSKKIFTKGK
jgi:hypothetical protein